MAGISVSISGCSSPPDLPSLQATALEGDVVAQVGPLDIGAETVVRILSAQALAVEEARDRAVRDALFGLAAESRGLRDSADVRAAIRARLARAVLSKTASEVSHAPPTDDEVEAKTADHFLELDRPEGFRVIHAVVLVSPASDDETKRRARRLAEQVAKAVAGAADAGDFESRAKAFSGKGIELRIESLDPVSADGRLLSASGGALVRPFAAAAAQLVAVGDQSPVVETEFGYHVMQLLERTPAKRVSLEQRRALLRDEIIATRAKDASAALLERLRQERETEVERSAGALMQSLQVLAP